MASFAPETLAIAALVAALAGAIRGITGFGGALVMSPPFAVLLGPLVAVPVVLLLESIAAAPMLVGLRQVVRWPLIGPIIAAACLTVPLGAYVLVSVDPQVMKRAIAAIVVVFSLLLLRGWRYRGEQRPGTGLALGAVSGTMAGATTLGGPPVILYLLAGPDPIDVTRANLTYFLGAISTTGIVILWAAGVLDARALLLAALLTPGYYVGMVAGTRLFARFDDLRFRQFTLFLMLLVSSGILLS